MSQVLDDRITELEQLVSGKHPNESGYIAMLKHKFGTPAERAEQAEKASSMAGIRPTFVGNEAADMRENLSAALARLADLEERERTRNAAAEIAAKNAPHIPTGTK